MTISVMVGGFEKMGNPFPIREALDSLQVLDSSFPPPRVNRILGAPENRHLLRYVWEDPFGAHVFPGNIPRYPPSSFLSDLDRELSNGLAIHLWVHVPLCRYRCRYCQFPVVPLGREGREKSERAKLWVDAAIAEARLWLRQLPHLGSVPIGEFNIFGGTPTQLPQAELARLLDFFGAAFHFDAHTTIGVEASPDSVTEEMVTFLVERGCTRITFGVQTFDDAILRLCGRGHTGQQAVDAVFLARRPEMERINGDLIYGMVDQGVADFQRDLEKMIGLALTNIVIMKLHLRSFKETGTAVSGVSPAPWESRGHRRKLEADGHRWPGLGEIYQMRELGVRLLEDAGYYEHPATYFPRKEAGPPRWKRLAVDQDRQRIEVGIGLGASSCCGASEGYNIVNPREYHRQLARGRIPLKETRGFTPPARIARSVRMALSSCQPLYDRVHRERFPGSSLFDGHWGPLFEGLEKRGLVLLDESRKKIALTPEGKTLVEAVINTEIE